ncbi:hypothetical protein E2C01_032654 [Portunus trituberculatus]|uniref:Uncharacterized protein n=1 Tax=Portunus trituberculatus TaxID=210409 RepID=A0A5B7F1Z6_PORTR|nr:hypothetical protein [Portunus trituberculatus]
MVGRDTKRCFPRLHATVAAHPVGETQTLIALTNTQGLCATHPLIPPYTNTHKMHSPMPNK